MVKTCTEVIWVVCPLWSCFVIYGWQYGAFQILRYSFLVIFILVLSLGKSSSVLPPPYIKYTFDPVSLPLNTRLSDVWKPTRSSTCINQKSEFSFSLMSRVSRLWSQLRTVVNYPLDRNHWYYLVEKSTIGTNEERPFKGGYTITETLHLLICNGMPF